MTTSVNSDYFSILNFNSLLSESDCHMIFHIRIGHSFKMCTQALITPKIQCSPQIIIVGGHVLLLCLVPEREEKVIIPPCSYPKEPPSFRGGRSLHSTILFVRTQMVTCFIIISILDTWCTPLSTYCSYRSICYLIWSPDFQIAAYLPKLSILRQFTHSFDCHPPSSNVFTQAFLIFRLTSLILLHIKVCVHL